MGQKGKLLRQPDLAGRRDHFLRLHPGLAEPEVHRLGIDQPHEQAGDDEPASVPEGQDGIHIQHADMHGGQIEVELDRARRRDVDEARPP